MQATVIFCFSGCSILPASASRWIPPDSPLFCSRGSAIERDVTSLLLLPLLLQVPGTAPWLCGLFAYNYSALPSLGLSGSALSGMKAAMPKLISGALLYFKISLKTPPFIHRIYLMRSQ